MALEFELPDHVRELLEELAKKQNLPTKDIVGQGIVLPDSSLI